MNPELLPGGPIAVKSLLVKCSRTKGIASRIETQANARIFVGDIEKIVVRPNAIVRSHLHLVADGSLNGRKLNDCLSSWNIVVVIKGEWTLWFILRGQWQPMSTKPKKNESD